MTRCTLLFIQLSLKCTTSKRHEFRSCRSGDRPPYGSGDYALGPRAVARSSSASHRLVRDPEVVVTAPSGAGFTSTILALSVRGQQREYALLESGLLRLSRASVGVVLQGRAMGPN